MKVALVHDYLFDYGGAERVLEALHEIWPQAAVFVSFYSPRCLGQQGARFKDWQIRTSWLDKLPFRAKLVSPLRFLAPLVWKNITKQLADYDLVISSAAWFITKGFQPQGLEVCYCHTPPRYLYGYQTSRNWRKYWPIKVYGLIVNHFLRQYDFNQAQKVDQFIANSEETKSRINKFYRRQAKVIYPPVDLPQVNQPEADKSWRQGDYYLYVGKLSEAKRVDLAIKACKQLKLKLKVVGGGPWQDYLQTLAGPQTEFLGKISDQELREVYQNCRALIFPAVEEDFGIVPVEAMAWGKPVVAYFSGGVKETVVANKTGVFFKDLNVNSVVKAIQKLEKSKTKSQDCQAQAQQFAKARFKTEIKNYINNLLDKPKTRS